jgi:protein O-GlcNAc transferase
MMALQTYPGGVPALLDRATAAHQAGHLKDAETLYQRVLSVDATQFDALRLLALLKYQQGQAAAAHPLIARAVAARPQSIEALSVLLAVLLALDRPEEALAVSDRILSINPRDAETHYNRAVLLARLGRCEDALAGYDQALALRSNDVDALFNRATVLAQLRRYDEALADYGRALALVPGHVEALTNRANVLSKLGHRQEALAGYDQVLSMRPDFVMALNNRAAVLKQLHRHREALASYERALAADRTNFDALYNRGNTLVRLGRHAEGLADLERAHTIRPDDAETLNALMMAYLQTCHWSKAADLFGPLKAHLRDGLDPFTLLALDTTPAEQLACARGEIERTTAVSVRLAAPNKGHVGKRRIAYLSADFHLHPTAWLAAELFELHDRARFEVVGVSFGPDDGSEMRARLCRSFDQFHDVIGRADGEVARLLRDLEVDIAIDLKGHTENKRPGILAHRPAPVQVSYLGYAGTMGADFIDYIIADRIVLPFDQQPFYTEAIVHLPDSYQVNDSKRVIAAQALSRRDAGLPGDALVLCCFNNSFKITRAIFDVWMRILGKVEGGVLWLLQTNDIAAANLRREAQARGIDPHRLVFAPKVALADHLARHALADLVVDTLPYNAHTTTSDALWTGVPVVACLGGTFPGRVAASLLRAVGLPELVTASLEQYEALALSLATDRDRLAAVRRKLAANRLTHPLFDTDRFRRHLEAAYATMWDIWQRGEPPRSFSVSPVAASTA